MYSRLSRVASLDLANRVLSFPRPHGPAPALSFGVLHPLTNLPNYFTHAPAPFFAVSCGVGLFGSLLAALRRTFPHFIFNASTLYASQNIFGVVRPSVIALRCGMNVGMMPLHIPRPAVNSRGGCAPCTLHTCAYILVKIADLKAADPPLERR
ncbi:hypothetical protein DFH09DRAFT_279205 [Mycena vulgaris]|nr:hypothetical protein DFH09DRAFT_279205 [Mycena vulgaris]